MTSISDGESGASVRAKLNSLFHVELDITAAGKWFKNPLVFSVVPSFGFQRMDGSLQIIEGACIGPLFYTEDTGSGLTSLALGNLGGVQGDFTLNGMNALTTLDLSSLTFVSGSLAISNMTNLPTLALPSLVAVGNSLAYDALDSITSIDLSALVSIGGNFESNTMTALTSIDLPSLTSIGSNFSPNAMPSVTSIDLSALVNVGAITLDTDMGAVQTITLTSALKIVTSGVTLTSCALNQATVDSILVRLAALDGTNGTVSYNNNAIVITGTSASPSGTGLAAKATLEGRGNTVTVN